jgi:hypothetical protein
MAAESGLNIRISGNTLGVAVSQDPPPTYDDNGLPNQPTQPTGSGETTEPGGTTEPGETTKPGETTEPGQTTETGTTNPTSSDPTDPTDPTEPGETTTTGAGETTDPNESDPGETTGTDGPLQPVIKLVRGSIITITFEAVEEEIAEAGETDETTVADDD